TLRAWYRSVEERYRGRADGRDAVKFWRDEFALWQGVPSLPQKTQQHHAVSRVPAPDTWGDPARSWRCHHGVDACESRRACELRTAREVGEGHARLEDVPAAIRKAVQAMAPAYIPQAVHA